MALPIITSVLPASGPTSGGDAVRLMGTGFGPRVSVSIGGACQVLAVRTDAAGGSVADVSTPTHHEAVVDVVLENLDAANQPIVFENTRLASAYRFVRPRLAREADLTRLVRTLLRELKRQVVTNVSLATSVDYDDAEGGEAIAIAIATLPALVLSGPTLRANRTYATNVAVVDVVLGPSGPELRRRRPAFTADLEFRLTVASERTVELINLMAAVATFLNRNRWIEMARDPEGPGAGVVRWELDPVGEFRTALDGADDVRAFTCGFVVRGFDVDEGLPIDFSKAVATPRLDTQALPPEGDT